MPRLTPFSACGDGAIFSGGVDALSTSAPLREALSSSGRRSEFAHFRAAAESTIEMALSEISAATRILPSAVTATLATMKA